MRSGGEARGARGESVHGRQSSSGRSSGRGSGHHHDAGHSEHKAAEEAEAMAGGASSGELAPGVATPGVEESKKRASHSRTRVKLLPRVALGPIAPAAAPSVATSFYSPPLCQRDDVGGLTLAAQRLQLRMMEANGHTNGRANGTKLHAESVHRSHSHGSLRTTRGQGGVRGQGAGPTADTVASLAKLRQSRSLATLPQRVPLQDEEFAWLASSSGHVSVPQLSATFPPVVMPPVQVRRTSLEDVVAKRKAYWTSEDYWPFWRDGVATHTAAQRAELARSSVVRM